VLRSFADPHCESSAEEADGDEAAAAVDLGPQSMSVVLTRASVVMQSHIAAARMREQRPDFSSNPTFARSACSDFDCAADAIEAGRAAAHEALPACGPRSSAGRPPTTTVLRRLVGGRQAA
jgi:predicted acylesterase/phospholipase RssA